MAGHTQRPAALSGRRLHDDRRKLAPASKRANRVHDAAVAEGMASNLLTRKSLHVIIYDCAARIFLGVGAARTDPGGQTKADLFVS
jgi:hypothetical protein